MYVEGCGVYECKAKGVFRNRKVKPLVGDRVEIQVIDETEHKGNMEEILPRTSEPVSYTHLDVYKRQRQNRSKSC